MSFVSNFTYSKMDTNLEMLTAREQLMEDIDSIIEIIDTNNDGQISYMELDNWPRIARCVRLCLLLQQSLNGLQKKWYYHFPDIYVIYR